MEIQKTDNGMERPGEPEQLFTFVAAPSLNLGSVISRTFGLLRKKPAIFFGLALLATLPSLLLGLGLYTSGENAIVLPKIVELIMGITMQGATAYAVFQTLRGNAVSFGEALTRGMARLAPLVIAALLVGLGTGLGYMLLVIPGVILLCLWYVTIPVCVVERLGAVKSMSRSAELTRGHRWSIFGLVVIIFLITALLFFVMVGLAVATGIFPFALAAPVLMVMIIPQAVGNVMVAIVYFDLRTIKEGVTIDNLVNVFD